jgi:hypothetical protein
MVYALLPRFARLCPSASGHNGPGVVDDAATELEAVVALCEPTTADDAEEDEGSDAVIEVLDLDVADKDDPCKVVMGLLDALEVLEVLMLEVGLIVVVGSGVDETVMVETELALVLTDVERDELVETVVETDVDDALTSAQSVETQ